MTYSDFRFSIFDKSRNRKTLRFLSLLVLLMLVTTGLAVAQTEIETWAELHEIRNNLNGNYILMNDLDQDSPGYDTYNTGNGWLPIGTQTAPFTGNFNGQGFTITGLVINRPGTNYVGLFGATSSSVVQNIYLRELEIIGNSDVGGLIGNINDGRVSNSSASGSVTAHSDVGGLVGQNVSAPIEQSFASVDVNAANSGSAAGGLVGRIQGFEGSVSQSYAIGDVDGGVSVGGLVGSVATFGSVSDSYATGEVSGLTDVGGLVGKISDTSGIGGITRSYAVGSVSVSVNNAGGLVGSVEDVSVNDSYWNTDTSGQDNAVGNGSSSGITGLSDVEMRQQASFNGFVFSDVWQIQEGIWYPVLQSNTQDIPADTSIPVPSLEAPFDGDDAIVLQPTLDWSVSDNVDGFEVELSPSSNFSDFFLKFTNITETKLTIPTTDLEIATVYYWRVRSVDNNETGDWSSTFSFRTVPSPNGEGTDVNPWEIANASQLNAVRYYRDGHFRQTADIDLTDATRSGGAYWNTGSGWEPIGKTGGSFLGNYNGDGHLILGMFINRPETNRVGLFGSNSGAVISGVGLVNPNVTGGNETGTLAGLTNNSTITETYAWNGSVEGGEHVGGLIGRVTNAASSIENVYTGIAVAGTDAVGGIIGEMAAGMLRYGYATEQATAATNSGAVIGVNTGTEENTYFNIDNGGPDNGTGTGLTTSQMRTAGSFTGFDFDNIWQIESGPFVSYPYFQAITYDEPVTEPEVNPIPGLYGFIPDENNILYVKKNVDEGNGSGSSWTNAIPELRDALAWAQDWDDDANGTLQIWVATGLYLPTDDGTDREASFQLVNGVEIYGGFVGDEDPADFNLANRDFEANQTILSGDTNKDDDFEGNVYHVFYHPNGTDLDNTAVLDGVTITAGMANGNIPRGGGMYNYNSHPVLRNVTIKDNLSSSSIASAYGGGMYNENSDPILTDVIFSGNRSQYGGGLSNRSGSNPTMTNVIFSGNEAGFGGGIYNNQSSPTLINVLITGNRGNPLGSGGILNYQSSPILLNVTISDNMNGGMSSTGNSYPILKNSIVWGNSEFNVYDRSGSNAGTNSTTIEYSIVPGEDDPENGNIDEDPLFVDSTDGDYRLQEDSPAINAGSNQAYIDAGGDLGHDTDLSGNPRVFDGETDGIDMGAYEFQGDPFFITPDENNILYVKKNVDGGNGSGNSWTNAISELRDALAWAQDWDADANGTLQIWVATGLYLPTDDGTDREASFQLVNGVEIYGGFVGGEESLDDRDWNRNLTILSGDIGGDDIEEIITDPKNQITGGNSYQVVWLDGTSNPITPATVIDGFTITAGQENSHIRNNGGGGLRCDGSGSGGECSPTITNVTFSGNMTVGFGGGMYIGTEGGKSNPILINVVFNGNWAKGDGGSGAGFGGGIYNYSADGESSPTLTNVIFRNNLADVEGAGMFNSEGVGGQCSPILTSVLFTGNSAKNGGALTNVNQGHPTLVNVTFSGNHAENSGGAIYNRSEMTITNSILWGNTAGNQADDFFNATGGSANASHTTIRSGESESVVSAGSLTCTNCTGLNPYFSDAANGDFSLSSNSPAVNAGDNSAIPSGIITDLAGNPRIYDGTADPDVVDMGAYEYQGDPDEIPQGKDIQLLVGNEGPYTFKGSDFSINDSVNKVRIIGIVGYGSVLVDGVDYSLFEEVPAEDITGGLLTFQHLDGVSYGYNYMDLEFMLIDDVGRESIETAKISIHVAATSVQLAGGEGWRFLTSPTSGEMYGNFLEPISLITPPEPLPSLYTLDQPAYQWDPVQDLSGTIDPGKGFIVYLSQEDLPVTLTSGGPWAPLDESYTYSGLDFDSDSGSLNPYNFFLLANPHPFSLDFCQMVDHGSVNVGSPVWFWDPEANGGNGDYVSLNCAAPEDVHIAPFQAFWIRTTDANPSLTIPEQAYLGSPGEGYFKQPDAERSAMSKKDLAGLSQGFGLTLNLRSQDGAFTNTARIRFSEQAATGLDEWDAPKLSPAGLAERWLAFYSLDEDGRGYAFQSIPQEFGDKTIIALDVATTEAGRYTLDWSLPDPQAFAGSTFLRDNHTGQVIELQQGASYSFEIDMGEVAEKSPSTGGFAVQGSSSFLITGTLSGENPAGSGPTPRFELLLAADGVDGLSELGAVPETFTLAQNYPNPFNPTTVIGYELPGQADVRLEVYDLLGRRVATLVDGQVAAGRHTVHFDAGGLSSGVYLYRLQAGSTVISRKLTVMK